MTRRLQAKLGTYVRAFYASDRDSTHCEGEVVAIAEFPTFDIVTAAGEHVNWAAHLTEEIPALQPGTPEHMTETDPGLLTSDEHRAVAMAAELWGLLCKITTDGLARRGDLDELIAHIHGIQRAVLKQAAARAYPELYRLLGGDPPPLPPAEQWPDSETVTELQPRKPWVAPRSGGYSAPGPGPNDPRPPSGPGAVSTPQGAE